MCIFFGRKIKCRKILKMRFSAPKTKKKTKFGQPVVFTLPLDCRTVCSVTGVVNMLVQVFVQ